MSIKSKLKEIFSFSFLLLFTLLFCACGLDTFYSLEPPVVCDWCPTYDTAAADRKCFDFYTNDATNKTLNDGGFKYLGTAIYYRIYTSSETMQSHIDSIQSVNNSTNYNSAASRMKSYGYKELKTKNDISPLLIEFGAAGSRHVKIRLTDYNEYNAANPDPMYLPYIEIDGTKVDVPRRNLTDGSPSFDFGRYNEENELCKKPISGDVDFESGSFSSGKEDIYYVSLYAVAVGQDTTFTEYYSNVLHLGAVYIDSNSKQN